MCFPWTWSTFMVDLPSIAKFVNVSSPSSRKAQAWNFAWHLVHPHFMNLMKPPRGGPHNIQLRGVFMGVPQKKALWNPKKSQIHSVWLGSSEWIHPGFPRWCAACPGLRNPEPMNTWEGEEVWGSSPNSCLPSRTKTYLRMCSVPLDVHIQLETLVAFDESIPLDFQYSTDIGYIFNTDVFLPPGGFT